MIRLCHLALVVGALSGCSALFPHVPVPAVTYTDVLVTARPEIVRGVLQGLSLPFPLALDDRGALPGGEATSYRITTALAVEGDSVGTLIRVSRRALPNAEAPSPVEVVRLLHDLDWERPVSIAWMPIWTDARSVERGLCPDPGAGVFDPLGESNLFESRPKILGGLDALADQMEYPRLMRDAGIEGRVWLRFRVEPDGSVGCVQAVESPSEGLSAAAAQAIRAVRFQPARQSGNPARFWDLLPINFTLR